MKRSLGTPPRRSPIRKRQDRPALDAAADLLQLGDVRPRFRELPQLLLQAGCRMILLRRLGRGEGGQVPCHVLELLDAVAHAGQAVQLSLGSAKDQVIRLDLPDVDAQRHPKNVPKRLLRSRRRDPGDEVHATIPSFDRASLIRDPPVARRGDRSRVRRFPGRRWCGGARRQLCRRRSSSAIVCSEAAATTASASRSQTSRLSGTFRRSSTVRPATGVRRTSQRTVARPAISGAPRHPVQPAATLAPPEVSCNAARNHDPSDTVQPSRGNR